MQRIYPIRLTRNSWNIPIYSIDQNKQILSSIINISTFDQNEPLTVTGILYNWDKIIIPDNSFHMLISFPLIRPADVEISTGSNIKKKGFSLSELIYCIKETYKCIYNDEERTSVPIRYSFKKKCRKCNDKNYKNKIKSSNNNEKMNCCICLSNIDTHLKHKLECNHYFHKDCIYKWIEHNGNCCPLCRKKIYMCNSCNGERFFYYERESSVIPIEHRNNELIRNTTNGIYGIYNYDLEDLYITRLFYNRNKKRLFLHVDTQ